MKWIGKLRDNISTFCGLIFTWTAAGLKGRLDEPEIHLQVDRLRYLIRLQLNPTEDLSRQIEDLMSEIVNSTGLHQVRRELQLLDDLARVTQTLLKQEWDKVKDEAESGRL